MSSIGLPVSYVPIPEHDTGTAPLPGLIAAIYSDRTADLIVFVPGRPDPAHFQRVPHGTGQHEWTIPDGSDIPFAAPLWWNRPV